MRSRYGMTILELLIATTLVAVAALVVAQSFAAGFRVWHRASQLGGNYEDALFALEAFQKDIRNTFPCRQTSFRGGGTWVEIPSLLSEAGKDGSGEQLGLIRYEFDIAHQDFERVSSSCEVITTEGVTHRERLASGVKALTLLYAERGGTLSGGVVWSGSWEGRTNNPVAVKVMWRGQQGEEVFDFERTVSLPIR